MNTDIIVFIWYIEMLRSAFEIMAVVIVLGNALLQTFGDSYFVPRFGEHDEQCLKANLPLHCPGTVLL